MSCALYSLSIFEQSTRFPIKDFVLQSPRREWPLSPRIHLCPITLCLLHHKNPTFVSVSLCGLLKWDATPPEWFNSSSLGLLSLPGSLLSPVTYLGGFLKRSQRKHFHFCSHLSLSLMEPEGETVGFQVGRVGGYTDSNDRHMGRWSVDVCDLLKF